MSRLDPHQLVRHKLANTLQTLLLLAGMGLLLALTGWLLGGEGWMLLLLPALLPILFAPSLSPRWVMRMYGARPLAQWEAPALHELSAELARRAGLTHPPALYYLPSPVRNAFTLGRAEHAALAVSDGLLRSLDYRELAGVLAHEVSHIRNHDTLVMGMADSLSRVTRLLSLFGQLLLLLTLPLYLFIDSSPPWLGLLVLIFAPSVSALLQLALSRTREFDADLDAVRLTGDPQGLAHALARIEYGSSPWLRRLLWPDRHSDQPSLLRTHPHTQERIDRLLSLVESFHPRLPLHTGHLLHRQLLPIERQRRHHWHGYYH